MDPQNLVPQQIGMPSDTSLAGSAVDPEILKQINTQAGANLLKDLFATGSLSQDTTNPQDKIAAILSTNHVLKPKKESPLSSEASTRLEKKLSVLLESLGGSPFPHTEKAVEKLEVKARKLISEMPGMRSAGMEATKRITNIILSLAANGELKDLQPIIEHELLYHNNNKRLSNKIEDLLDSGDYEKEAPTSQDERQKLHDYVASNKIQDEMNEQMKDSFANGGEVKKRLVNNRIAEVFPDQGMMMSSAKTRMHGYLNSLRPIDHPGLPFDTKSENKEQRREYESALDLAAKPLSILDEIRKGSLDLNKMKHFVGLHPELHGLLSKKISENITKMQLSGKKPPYPRRQATALFLGSPLDSTMTPPSIQAAQTAFIPKTPPQPTQPGKIKKGTAKLGSKSNDLYNTADQDAEKDRSTR